MAKVLKEFPGKGRCRIGTYNKFLDGRVYELSLSEFPTVASVESLKAALYQAAKAKGVSVRISVTGTTKIAVQSYAE